MPSNMLRRTLLKPNPITHTLALMTCAKTSWKINGFVDVPQNVSAQLKTAVALNLVSIAIEADGFWYQFYFGGVFHSSCGTDLDHGVLAVGYGTVKIIGLSRTLGEALGEKAVTLELPTMETVL